MKPKSKFSEFNEIATGNFGGNLPSEFFHRKWIKEANNLKKNDLFEGLLLETQVNYICGKPEEALRNVRNFDKVLPNRLPNAVRANVYLKNGMLKELSEIALNTLKENETNSINYTEFMAMSIQLAEMTLESGFLESALSYFVPKTELDEKWKKIAVRILDKIQHNLDILDGADVKLDLYQFIAGLSSKVCGKTVHNKIPLNPDDYVDRCTLYCINDDLKTTLKIESISENTNIEQCLEMNELFLDALIENKQYPYEEYSKISLEYHPAEMVAH